MTMNLMDNRKSEFQVNTPQGTNVRNVVERLSFIRNRLLVSINFLLRSDLDFMIQALKKRAQKSIKMSNSNYVHRRNKKKLDNSQRALYTLRYLQQVVEDLIMIERVTSGLASQYGREVVRAAIPRRFLSIDIPFMLVNTNGSLVEINLGEIMHRIMSFDPGIRDECTEVLRNIKSDIHVHDPKHPVATSTLDKGYSADKAIAPWKKVDPE